MKSIIITIGDELLIGQVINTNAAFIAEHLNSVGIEVAKLVTIPDNEGSIIRSLEEEAHRHDVVIITGGLGPTHDDVTKKALCSFFNTNLVSSDIARRTIEQFLRERNRLWSGAAEEQTYVPHGCVVIPNNHGTAPGLCFEQDRRHLIAMPGVPYEMEYMIKEFVVPYLRTRGSGNVVLHRTLRTTAMPESVLASKLGDVERFLDGGKLAFLPSLSGVRLRISVVEPNRELAEEKLRVIEEMIRSKVNKYIFGVDDDELEAVVGRMLTEMRLTIAIAESCTGGYLSDLLTNISGSSKYFERGLITYSNKSKTELLGIDPELIATHGAVSEEVAKAMATRVRGGSGVSIGISTTGIAGPTGGSTEKPVGLVWIGYSDSEATFAIKFNLGADRVRIKERAAYAALEILRRRLLGMPA